LSRGNPFVRLLLTASSVIPVMPACMLTVPNPGSRNEWPPPDSALVIALELEAHLPHKQNKAAKQHP
jgi:hypothetical protein